MKKCFGFLFMTGLMALSASPALAEEAAKAAAGGGGNSVWFYTAVAIAAAFGMSIAAVGTGIAQGNAVRSAVESIARNPGASGKILYTLLIGLAMIESLAIYALVIALILLFANPFLKFVG